MRKTNSFSSSLLILLLIGLLSVVASLANSTTRMITGGGDVSVYLAPNGTVWTWGSNYGGLLGEGTFSPRRLLFVPGFDRDVSGQVPGLMNVTAIDSQSQHILALKSDGTVWAWGKNFSGAIGDGTAGAAGYDQSTPGIDKFSPVHVDSNAVAIAAGTFHSLAVHRDGSLWSWGSNAWGELGNGEVGNMFGYIYYPPTDKVFPQPVSIPSPVIAVTAGQHTSFALTADGRVWSWGFAQAGYLGDGATEIVNPTPKPIPGLSDVKAISAASWHCLALKRDGTVWAWGENLDGRLGNGKYGTTHPWNEINPEIDSSIPVQVSGLTDVVQIAAGILSSYALRADGTVWAWGNNMHGVLGLGDFGGVEIPGMPGHYCQPVPVRIPTLEGIKAIGAGALTGYAIGADGTVWAWGENCLGAVGNGTHGLYEYRLQTDPSVDIPFPVRVLGLPEPVPFNQPPIFQQQPDVWVDEGEQVEVQLTAIDRDGDPVGYTGLILPPGATLDPSSGLLVWTPSYSQSGEYHVSVQANDGQASVVLEFKVYVRNVTAEQALATLLLHLQALSLDKGIENSLTTKLQAAGRAIEKGQKKAARGVLGAFLNEVNALSGKQIPEAAASGLVAGAVAVIELLAG